MSHPPSHPHPHEVPKTTHTVDMSQIEEINRRLSRPEAVAPTAAQLGLTDVATLHGSTTTRLTADSVLVSLNWDGDPEFPDIFGHFASAPGETSTAFVQLHTAALRELSRHMKIRQHWGIEPEAPHFG